MTDFLFLDRDTVLFLHDAALAEHGGLPGIRDEGLFQSALQRPDDKAYYEPGSTISELAASLAFGLAKNHPFNDANKRTSLASTDAFLILNGMTILATPREKFETWVALASDRISEAELAAWIAARLAPFVLDPAEAPEGV